VPFLFGYGALGDNANLQCQPGSNENVIAPRRPLGQRARVAKATNQNKPVLWPKSNGLNVVDLALTITGGSVFQSA